MKKMDPSSSCNYNKFFSCVFYNKKVTFLHAFTNTITSKTTNNTKLAIEKKPRHAT